MRITPADLTPDPLPIAEVIQPGSIDYAPDVRQTGPLTVKGEADLIEEHRGPKDVVEDIRVRASFVGDFELLCARCLEPIPHHSDQHFDLLFRPSGVDAESGERAISEAETEIGYYEQNGLLLEDVVREQVLLSLPDRSLCQDDCKGICPRCGGNLNETVCNCVETEVDTRWAGLQGFGAAAKSESK
jgi:uncharacterized protein